MAKLYPLKFIPQYTIKLWGGNRLKDILNRDDAPDNHLGESWELSNVEGRVSVVANGFLAGNTLQEIVEIYMDEILGEKVYNEYGLDFPLLVKFIEAQDDLSIQVHPNNQLAKERHNSYGKSEMWYVMDAEPDSELILGFKKGITKDDFIANYASGNILNILNTESVKKGDVFYVPAGRVHAIGKGTIVAEIQQTSDITYRIFDYNRVEADGTTRDLHVDMALDALDFSEIDNYRTDYKLEKNKSSLLVKSEFFTANKLDFDTKIEIDYNFIDSFVIYICLSGTFTIKADDTETIVNKGETILIPAALKNFMLYPEDSVQLMEVYIS